MGLLEHQRQGLLLMLVGAVSLVLGSPVGVLEEGGGMEPADIIFGIVCMLAGLLMLCFGYRLFKIVMFLAGFFFGYWLCYTIMVAIGLGDVDNEEWIIFGCSLAAGLLFGLLTVCLFIVGIFLLGLLAGFFFGVWILTIIPADAGIHVSPWPWIFACGLGLIVGVIAIIWQKPLIIVSSSFVGSYMLFYGIDVFADTGFMDAMQLILSGTAPGNLEGETIAMIVCCIVSMFIGIVIQLRTFRDYDHKEEQPNDLYIKIN